MGSRDHPRSRGAGDGTVHRTAAVHGIIPAHAGRARCPSSAKSPSRDHPRSRGAGGKDDKSGLRGVGSSPLTRGGPRADVSRTGRRRIIPAHAGRAPWSRRRPTARRDHPRSRGAGCGRRGWSVIAAGSSPLTRGGLDLGETLRSFGGIIPAHAGRAAWRTCPPRPGRDHPRSRGAGRRRGRPCPGVKGSSPLTRGGHHLRAPIDERLGIIPAHAGRACSCTTHRTRHRDHPRSRGAGLKLCEMPGVDVGSSPLTRGGQQGLAGAVRFDGIIPAHAGRAATCPATRSMWRDHPRSRGAGKEPKKADDGSEGSSPLTRGGPAQSAQSAAERGIIPAHAGRARCSARITGARRDHPRSRGAGRIHLRQASMPPGSSPLTRGGPNARTDPARHAGIIPAHAGRARGASRCPRRTWDHPRSRGAGFSSMFMENQDPGSSPLTRGGHLKNPVIPGPSAVRGREYLHFRARRYCAALL